MRISGAVYKGIKKINSKYQPKDTKRRLNMRMQPP